MAYLTTANGHGKYFDENAKEILIRYALNPIKTPHEYKGGVNVDYHDIAESTNRVSAQFGKESGVQLRHFVVTFHPKELRDPDVADEIAQQIVMYLGREFQVIYAVHENTDHLHFHIIMNSVSYVDGHRYYGTRKEFYDLLNFVKGVLRDYGIFNLRYQRANSGEKYGVAE